MRFSPNEYVNNDNECIESQDVNIDIISSSEEQSNNKYNNSPPDDRISSGVGSPEIKEKNFKSIIGSNIRSSTPAY